MNIEYANTIALSEVLSKMGFEPARQRDNELYYLSPFEQEEFIGLVVDTTTNIWYDYALEKGGNVVALVCAHLEKSGNSFTQADALRWLENMIGNRFHIDPVQIDDYSDQHRKFIITDIRPLKCGILKRYIEQRGISPDLAKSYLEEVTVYNKATESSFPALGFKNEAGGYELRNPFFKGATLPSTITYIRGLIPKPDGFHVFHSVFDYLSMLTRRKGKLFGDDVIILNSVANLRDAAAYIRYYGFRRACLWLDNDNAGDAAARSLVKFFATKPALEYVHMNQTYHGFKDVNAWHMHTLNNQSI